MSVSLAWTGRVSVSMRCARGLALVAVVEQDGLLDVAQFAEQDADGHVQVRRDGL